MRAVSPLSPLSKNPLTQTQTDVLQVAHHYFENAIAFFTRRINKCISMMCANGEVAPFVGHNAFLRWSALQDAAFGGGDVNSSTPGENRAQVKIWSEDNVSEDFDMALRLIRQGYIVRFVLFLLEWGPSR
jgi:cellulose synthase/poly-beta-1,6-N-acetylglucosamine synthase-like glycosyltransferase